MDSGTLSLLVSIASLGLGFIAAYGSLRTFALKLFAFSREAARAAAKSRDESLRVFASHPSALVAHIANRCVRLSLTVLALVAAQFLLRRFAPDGPEFVRQSINLAGGLFFGTTLGSLSVVTSEVKRRVFAELGLTH
jgi:hypothetical protein